MVMPNKYICEECPNWSDFKGCFCGFDNVKQCVSFNLETFKYDKTFKKKV